MAYHHPIETGPLHYMTPSPSYRWFYLLMFITRYLHTRPRFFLLNKAGSMLKVKKVVQRVRLSSIAANPSPLLYTNLMGKDPKDSEAESLPYIIGT